MRSTKELIKSLSTKSLFKLIGICCSAFYIPVAIIMAFLALAGIVPANLNGRELTGFLGFIVPLFTAPIFIAILTVAHWAVLAIGLAIAKYWFRKREDKIKGNSVQI
ncbi:hypothetical protein [Echinicola pacifica]|uniref:hypothetical protein n=1 Tax=Echinicola pacifica TaxID=346377 RepID=UPI0012F7C523|nr:hypothetical protein [Echinicola pacifica]